MTKRKRSVRATRKTRKRNKGNAQRTAVDITSSKPHGYIHGPVDRETNQIRLIKIHCQGDVRHYDICTFPHDNAPDHVALSYTWGAQTPTFDILVDGDKTLQIRENLHNFLQIYKYEGYIWIDQICIDQSNVEERNHQVTMMSNIYRRASYVLIWSQTLYRESPIRVLESSTEHDIVEQALAILKDAYFSRLWVIQEILLAQDVKILNSVGTTSFSDFRKCFTEMIAKLRGDIKLAFVNNYVSAYQLLTQTHTVPFALYKCIRLFHKSECKDPKDRVYGLMGLVSESQRLAIHYSKSTHEVYSDVVLAFCSAYATDIVEQTIYQALQSPDPHRIYYLLTLQDLLKTMNFSSEEELALEHLLNKLWKEENFGRSGHSPITFMGFEQQDSNHMLNHKLNRRQGRWWYEVRGKRRYFEIGAAGRTKPRKDDGFWDALAAVDYMCALDPTLNTIPHPE